MLNKRKHNSPHFEDTARRPFRSDEDRNPSTSLSIVPMNTSSTNSEIQNYISYGHPNNISSSASALPESSDYARLYDLTTSLPTPPSDRRTTWPGLQALKDALRETTSNVFEPLKSAVTGLAWCFENEAIAREDYKKLRSVLDGLLQDLSVYFSAETPPSMTPVLIALS
ncbi:hypothetical protein FRC07_013756, partial [Ceratobasidium sp. 392]